MNNIFYKDIKLSIHPLFFTMPVSKEYIVKGKIMSFLFLEVLHLALAAGFVLARSGLYGLDNFTLNPNTAFFGEAFIGFGLFNILFFPGYFRTANNFGVPLIAGIVVITFFFAGVELAVLAGEKFARFMEGASSSMRLFRLGVLLFGILLLAGMNLLAVRMSIKRFDKVDL